MVVGVGFGVAPGLFGVFGFVLPRVFVEAVLLLAFFSGVFGALPGAFYGIWKRRHLFGHGHGPAWRPRRMSLGPR